MKRVRVSVCAALLVGAVHAGADVLSPAAEPAAAAGTLSEAARYTCDLHAELARFAALYHQLGVADGDIFMQTMGELGRRAQSDSLTHVVIGQMAHTVHRALAENWTPALAHATLSRECVEAWQARGAREDLRQEVTRDETLSDGNQ